MPKFATPQGASGFAQQQLTRAERAAKSGKVAEAYEATVAGWEALRPHSGDANCKRLSEVLLARIEVYGEQLPKSDSSELLEARLKVR